MSKKRLWLLLLFLAGLGGAGLWLWPIQAKDDDQGQRQSARVALRSLTESVTAIGVIRPVVGAEVKVGSRISGTVVSLPVEVGDRVTQGQLLAALDDSALQAALDEVRADLNLAYPRIQLAESTLARLRRLAEQGLASTQDLETAQRDLAVEQATLKSIQARLRSAEITLGYTRITAPIDGVVAEIDTQEGETVAADFSAPTFVTIVDLERLEVLAYVDETDIGRIFVGQQASFAVDTYPDVEFSAQVVAIQPKAELQGSVVNYIVRLIFESQPETILRPEMTAHVGLVVSQKEAALTAPRSALRRSNGRQFLLVERDGQWLEQDVRTGWRSESSVEILSGVTQGERVAISTN